MSHTDLAGNVCDVQTTQFFNLQNQFCIPDVKERFITPSVILMRIPTIISWLSLFFLGVYILRHPKLKIHPYPLIGLICVTDSFLFFMLVQLTIATGCICNSEIFYAYNPHQPLGFCWMNSSNFVVQ